jgi:lsr operon transcriptional repressor
MPTGEQLDLMAIAAWLYYEEKKTHEEIAGELKMSRVAVTRLLQKAREQGIVKFSITRALPYPYLLSREIVNKYHLRDVVIVQSGGDENSTMNALGKAGAQFLRQNLFDGCKLGMAWSKCVSSIASHLQPPEKPLHLKVHELAGTYLMQGVSYGISWKVSEILKAPLVSLPVPVVVTSWEARQAILNEKNIQDALTAAQEVDIAFVGIGSIQNAGTIVQTGFMKEEERQRLADSGVTGEILMRFFDEEGRHVPTELDQRVIGIQWEDLGRIPHVVAMSAGAQKAGAVHAALKSGVIHSLITDTETAQKLK